jgi:hypothetical protein
MLDGLPAAAEKGASPRAYGFLERLFGHKRVDERAIQRLGYTPERLDLDGPSFFRLFNGDEGRLFHIQTFRKLRGCHAEGLANAFDPPAYGRLEPDHWLQALEPLIETGTRLGGNAG